MYEDSRSCMHGYRVADKNCSNIYNQDFWKLGEGERTLTEKHELDQFFQLPSNVVLNKQ